MKTVKYINLLAFILIVNQFSIQAQHVRKQDVIKFMKEYEKYASFTENGLVYEKDYETKFEALFVRSGSLSKKDKDSQVFNDVDSLNRPPYISVKVYIKKVRKIYPKGMNVDVNISKIGASKIKNGKEIFEINVHKKIYDYMLKKKS